MTRPFLLLTGFFTVALVGFGCFLLLGAAFCAATLHVLKRKGPAPVGASRVEIRTNDSASLVGWWFSPPNASGGCVLVLHGIGDFRGSSAGFSGMFLPAGYSVLAPDNRAHGESGGNFITYGLLEKYDVLAWTRWMQERNCQRIYGLGESLGASILLQALAEHASFRAVVAESAFADLREVGEYRLQHSLPLPQGPAKLAADTILQAGMLYARLIDGFNFRQVSPVQSMRLSTVPVLFIHGLSDQRTPPENSEQLAKVHPTRDRLWLVPNLGHASAASIAPNEFRDQVLGWFAQH